MKPKKILRAALYARYSSDIQNDASIEDQFVELQKAATRLGLTLDRRHYYADRGVSGASLFDRPGITRDLMNAASRGEFDVVLVELTDRLSRERADLFWLARRFRYHNVQIFTPMGEVSDMQLTFDGHINEDFLKKLAVRVKRGHERLAREGKIAGSLCYGYDLVPGQPGVRVINEQQATIIRRIFAEYANGVSPRSIVAALKRDNIPSPTGARIWCRQIILGGQCGNGSGMLHRDVYRGKIVRNRFKNVKNPDTGRVLKRPGDPDEITIIDAPHLRIVSDELWDAAHAVREQRRNQANPNGTMQRKSLARKQHLLANLIKCAACGGPMPGISTSHGGRVACANAIRRGTCTHRKSYSLDTITSEVVAKVAKELTSPDKLKQRMKSRADELAKTEKETSAERQSIERQIERLNVQIGRLVEVLTDGDLPVAEVKEKITAKEAERVSLKERLRLLADQNSNVVSLQPAAMTVFAKSIETLVALLERRIDDPRCRRAFANLVDCVLVHPTPKKMPYELSLYARVSAIGNLNLFPAGRSHEKIVAEEGVSPLFASGHPVTSELPEANNNRAVVLLGRWTASNLRAVA